jgi:hypothetical protein
VKKLIGLVAMAFVAATIMTASVGCGDSKPASKAADKKMDDKKGDPKMDDKKGDPKMDGDKPK